LERLEGGLGFGESGSRFKIVSSRRLVTGRKLVFGKII